MVYWTNGVIANMNDTVLKLLQLEECMPWVPGSLPFKMHRLSVEALYTCTHTHTHTDTNTPVHNTYIQIHHVIDH